MIFDNETNEIVHSILGDFQIIADHRGNSDRTSVIEVCAKEQRLFVKIHNRLTHWHPEVYAYKNWTKSIEPFAPSMYASFNNGNIFGIIVTPIDGKTVNEAQITDDSKLLEIYYEAGQLFKKMQTGKSNSFFGMPREDGSPYEKNSITNPEEYAYTEIERLFKRGYEKGLFADSHKSFVQCCLNNCSIFSGDVPTPTYWDFSQNNWMINENGKFTGFIDFEHTLWGLPLDSFGVIVERYTFDKPHLRDALFEGYGLPNDSATKEKMIILNLKMALADICNGYINNHPRFLECGKRMLAYLTENFSK